MSRRSVEAAPIRQAPLARSEFLGADRELIIMTAFVCACMALFAVVKATGIWRIVVGTSALALWTTVLVLARAAAKKDPLYFRVLFRAIFNYQARYEARPTPFRRPRKPPRWC